MGSVTNSSEMITTVKSVEVVSNAVDGGSHTLSYIVIPLGALAVAVIIAFVVSLY